MKLARMKGRLKDLHYKFKLPPQSKIQSSFRGVEKIQSSGGDTKYMKDLENQLEAKQNELFTKQEQHLLTVMCKPQTPSFCDVIIQSQLFVNEGHMGIFFIIVHGDVGLIE